ncbi:MAG: hypothetical protein WDM70_04355 [Nitrosomonadales bacterium]
MEELSVKEGRITEATRAAGAVFLINKSGEIAYMENATATKGWTPDSVLKGAADEDISHVGRARPCLCVKVAGGVTHYCLNKLKTGKFLVRLLCWRFLTESRYRIWF